MHTYQTYLEMKKVSLFTALKDYFSENTFNMHITTVPMHFRSINQVLKYAARITSLHRKTVCKALKTCVIQILYATRTSLPITTTAFTSFAFWTIVRVHWLKHNIYFIVLSNNELHHTDRSGSVYRYAKLYAAIILWNDFPVSSLKGTDLWLCPPWWNFKGPLETRSCDATDGWQRVTCGRHGSVVVLNLPEKVTCVCKLNCTRVTWRMGDAGIGTKGHAQTRWKRGGKVVFLK
jgi:hypothetical protein